MVILGGLEVVAAGYLIHKHNKNKRERQRLEEEAAALDEQQYKIFPSDDDRHRNRRHRSHSRRRHSRSNSHDRRPSRSHSYDGRHSHDHKRRHESPRPPMPAVIPQQYSTPPPQYAPPAAGQQAPPQDVKYGWTDDQTAPAPQQQQPQQQYPPTGWPAHWEQSLTPDPNRVVGTPPVGPQGRPRVNTAPVQGRERRQHGSDSEWDDSDSELDSPHVRFAVPGEHVITQPGHRSSPPPAYRN